MNEGMSELTFASSAWFWALLVLVPLFLLRGWRQLSTARHLPGLVSPRLQKQLVVGKGQAQRWVIFVLQILALSAVIGALARPQLGFEEIETETEGRNLIIALDTSRSMLAVDLPPNRLTRSKLAATDIIAAFPEDRIALIAFAGRPFLQAPLTMDHEAIRESIDQIDTEIIPRGGTNIAAATALAIETVEEAKIEQSALVIFSDGEALEGTGELEEVKAVAAEAGLTIVSVGVGTEAGSIIPELSDLGEPITGEFVRDESGQVVRSRLDAAGLQALASAPGFYVHLGGPATLSQVVGQVRRSIDVSRSEGKSRLRPIERFMWPLSFALGFFILSHIVPQLWVRRTASSVLSTSESRPSIAINLTTALLLATPLVAEDSFEAGHAAFERGDFDGAIATYEKALA
ncbi:MAG: VWA domain-containing protein, partial [Planctomycetota bacterium]